MSRPWPTLAAACWVARSRGRFARPSGASPAEIAPEETRMISVPALHLAASTSESSVSASSEIPPLMLVRDDDPTLPTIRRARASMLRSSVLGSSMTIAEESVTCAGSLLMFGVQPALLDGLGSPARADGLGPDTGFALGFQLGPCRCLRLAALDLFLALLAAGGTVADVGEADVG